MVQRICGGFENADGFKAAGKDVSDFDRGFTDGTWLSGAEVTETAQLFH